MTDALERWSRIAAIFHDAQERPEPQRGAFLDEACAGDLAIKAEVEALLAADSGAGEFLAAPGPSAASLLLGGESSTLPAGAMIGAYRIVRPLGQGGMGVVYLAEDTRLARPVTLKALHPGDAADEKRRERLRLEARAAAALVHPNVATVYALEEASGEIFIVSEYVPGRTARERLDAGGPLSIHAALEVVLQAARGLEAAHRRGIIHRDLKPENLLVADSGEVRILDFGIARDVAAGHGGPRLTATGAMVGTPGYMAPEQLEGAPGDVRSDLFALGIVLYELVSGSNPFQGKTASSTAARILTVEPAPLSRMNPLSPPALDAIVTKCLMKSPSDRYSGAAELLRDLESLKQAATRGAAMPGPPQAVPPARLLWRVHQLVLLALLAALAIGSWWLGSWVGQPLRYSLFAVLLALTVADGTVRVHLLFVERHTPGAILRQLARARPWLTRLDLLVALIVTLAASRVVAEHQAIGTAMLAVVVGMAVAAWLIEPATTEAAFPELTAPRA